MVFDVEKMGELVSVAEVDGKRNAIAIGRAPKRTAVAPFASRGLDGCDEFCKMIREKNVVVLGICDEAASRLPQRPVSVCITAQRRLGKIKPANALIIEA